jgi:hypothetical protein
MNIHYYDICVFVLIWCINYYDGNYFSVLPTWALLVYLRSVRLSVRLSVIAISVLNSTPFHIFTDVKVYKTGIIQSRKEP